ncbi:MAG: TRZ/ATZ family hydrolase [Granulosicoccus sp.]|nr:TRZ/ATZ family hydrolase [Granulosicoccus sp.]
MDAHMRVLREYSLVVIDGRIVACAPWLDAMTQYPDLIVVDRRSGILMPGLVNAHTHLAMNLLRGFADDKPLKTWLEQHVWPTEAAYLSPAYVRDGTALALAECLLCGVTTVNDMYFFPDVTAATVLSAGMRATVGLIVLDIPTAWAGSVDEYISRGLSVHDTLRDEPLITTAFAPHAPYTVSREPLERIATLSAELDVPVHMHVHETAEEVQSFEREHGMRPIARLDEIGLLNSSLLAVHLTQLTDAEIVRLGEAGVNAIHCPESNLKLASGVSPIADLIAAGVNIAVGTDGAASNNDLDLLGELRTASFLAKVFSDNAATLPAAQALRMVTIDAAKALGLAEHIGSLEVGKAADCIIIEPGLGMLPIYDVLAQVIYTQSSQYVTDVWVAGKQLLQHRQLLTMDTDKIRHSAQTWAAKISK